MSLRAAREHLNRATKQWERAASDAWEPADPASCVTNAFYAYENVIVAVAEAKSLAWAKNHYKKAELAKELAQEKVLSKDLSDRLLRLNDLRKDVSYGEPGMELSDEDLESIVSELEGTIGEVEGIVSGLEEEAYEGNG
jgi:uncharacterized protein YutE (UPF0331/DUF86 family)